MTKTALITGGASGIGRAFGRRLARRGVKVVLADRQRAAAQHVADGICASGGHARAVELDVRDAAAFQAVAREMVEREGRIDYLFNNAGIGVGGDVEEYDQSAWDDVLDVNLRGVTHGIQAVYPRMLRQGSGHIINTASMAGLIPMPGGTSYCASKHAVVGLGKALRIEAERHGVRVSTLCPGVIRTPILTGGEYGRRGKKHVPDEVVKKLWDRYRPMDVDAFAVEAMKDIDKGVAIIIVPRWYKALFWLERLAPSLSESLNRRGYLEMVAATASAPEAEPSTEMPVDASANASA